MGDIATRGVNPTDTTRSPAATLRTLGGSAVRIEGGLWARRQATNRDAALPHGYRMLEAAGNLENLRIAAGTSTGRYRGPVFMDSDVYKWIEAAAYEYARIPGDWLRSHMTAAIDIVGAAQGEDGYLNSHYQVAEPGRRWTDFAQGHELYCAGHLFQAAVAHHRATGEDRLLQIAGRFADYLDATFGPGKRSGTPGHPEIEMGLTELYRETGERRYLDLALFFLDQRGRGWLGPGRYNSAAYYQDRVPVREASRGRGPRRPGALPDRGRRRRVPGDRRGGAPDGAGPPVGGPHQPQALRDRRRGLAAPRRGVRAAVRAAERARLLRDVRGHRQHPLELADAAGHRPGALRRPDRPHASQRGARRRVAGWRAVLLREPPGQQRSCGASADAVAAGERSGTWSPAVRRTSCGSWRRSATTSRRGIARGFRCTCTRRRGSRRSCRAGRPVGLRMETRYPWEGSVRLTIEGADGGAWALAPAGPRMVRPCHGPDQRRRGRGRAGRQGLPPARATWRPGDAVELELPMDAGLIEPHPAIESTRGCLAIERGPLVYCLEQADQRTLRSPSWR